MVTGGIMDWKRFIQVVMIDEKASRAKYNLAAKAASSEAMKEIFTKLAYEEDMHIATLTRFEKELGKLVAD
jgi:rubrerythrin